MPSIYETLRLEIRITDRIQCDPKWAKGGKLVHSDPFSRLYYIRSGEGVIWSDAGGVKLRPKRLYLIPSYSMYHYRCPKRMDLTFVHFTAHLGGVGRLGQFVDWPLEVRVREAGWVEERIDLILEKEGVSFLRRDGALRQLLALFAEASAGGEKLHPQAQRFLPVLKHVERHLSRAIPMAELAAIMHLQPNYFSNCFCDFFGEAPSRYVQRRRIEVAAERLALAPVPLKTLAAELGFADAFHFSRTFKAFLGLPPSRYRASLMTEG